jgi:hypothetical protein
MRTRIPSSHRGHRASVAAWLAAILGAAVFVVLTAVAGVWSMLQPSREVAAMRDGFLESTAMDGETEIELSVGPLIFGMLRTGLNFVELEPEVRSALGAVRGTSVGIYRVDCSRWDRSEMMAAMDAAMARRGWERLAAVLEDQQCAGAGPRTTGGDFRPGQPGTGIRIGPPRSPSTRSPPVIFTPGDPLRPHRQRRRPGVTRPRGTEAA